MTKHAWIENGRIRDIAPGEPFSWYHSDVAKFYDTLVPDDANKDDFWDGVKATKPPEPVIIEAEPAPRQWTAEDVRKGLTLAERVKWDNDKSDEIKTAKVELVGQNFKAKVKEVLDMLVAVGDISQASATLILAKTNETTTIPATVV